MHDVTSTDYTEELTMSEDAATVEQSLTRLVHTYSDAVNRCDWDAFAACFAEDGVWTVGAPLSFAAQGRVAIRETVARRVGDLDIVLQMVGTVLLVEHDGDRARGRATIRELTGRDATAASEIMGLYEDELIRVDGHWYFQQRTFNVLTISSVPNVPRNYRDRSHR
jgi:ketosteroid isomerase-like protein